MEKNKTLSCCLVLYSFHNRTSFDPNFSPHPCRDPTFLACPGWSPKETWPLAGETHSWLVSQTHQALTGHRFVINISCYFQSIGGDSTVAIPNFRLRFFLHQRLKITTLKLSIWWEFKCLFSFLVFCWWIHGRKRGIRESPSEWNIFIKC